MAINVNDRRETWLFSEIEQKQGKPVYRRLKFDLVQYGDDPEMFLEPVSSSNFQDVIGNPATPLGFRDNGVGRVVNFQFVKGRYSAVHSFDDYDAAAIGCDPTGI